MVSDLFDRFVALYLSANFALAHALRMVGIEEEWLLVNRITGEMGHALKLIVRLAALPGWTAKYDSAQPDLLIAASHEGYGEVSVDAGRGTLEWSSKPWTSLLILMVHFDELTELLSRLVAEQGEVIFGVGRTPITVCTPETLVPKDRYSLFLHRFGPNFNLLGETASHQTHVQCRGPEDMIELTNHMLALSGLFGAMTANSGVYAGRADERQLSSRVEVWDTYAGQYGRVGIPNTPFEDINDWCLRLWRAEYVFGPTNTAKTEYALGGELFGNAVQSMNGLFGLAAMFHEGCWWLDARARFIFGTVEVRPCCQKPQWMRLAMPALILGLAENRAARRALVDRFGWQEWRMLRIYGARYGMSAYIGGETPIQRLVAEELIPAARAGLLARGQGEEVLLTPLDRVLKDGSPGLHQRIVFDHRGIRGLVDEFGYR